MADGASCFVVSQPDYDGENIDSIWLEEQSAKNRAAELGTAFLTEYPINSNDGLVRNGWYAKGQRHKLCWSDWK